MSGIHGQNKKFVLNSEIEREPVKSGGTWSEQRNILYYILFKID